MPREYVGNPLISNKVFTGFAADNSQNRKYFPSDRELPIPAAFFNETAGAAFVINGNRCPEDAI